jgi:hypothetical protein
MNKQTYNDLVFSVVVNVLLITFAWNANNPFTLGFVKNIPVTSLDRPLDLGEFFVFVALVTLLTFLIISLARINRAFAFCIMWILIIPTLFGGFLIYMHVVLIRSIDLNPKTGDLYMLGVAIPFISLLHSLLFTVASALSVVFVYKKIKNINREKY